MLAELTFSERLIHHLRDHMVPLLREPDENARASLRFRAG